MRFVVVLLVVAFCSSAFSAKFGIAYIKGTQNDPTVVGNVTFIDNGNNTVTMTVKLEGITKGLSAPHGMHIHQWGDLNSTDGLSAGPHWDPLGAGHGCPEINDTARSMGDTGNWDVDANGVIDQSKVLNLIGLTGTNSVIGHAVVLHQATDNCFQVPSAGPRLAFGVIGVGNATRVGDTVNDAYNGEPGWTVAVCDLETVPGSNQNIKGRVYFSQPGGTGPTTVTARVEGITGDHAFHIHLWGDLGGMGGLAAGLHFNPTNNNHGFPTRADRHVGDMGNIYFYENNVAYYKFVNDKMGLGGPNGILGRAAMVHAAPDNCSNPVGFAGSRYAYCIVGIGNATLPALEIAPATPTTQDDTICGAPSSTTGAPPATTGVPPATTTAVAPTLADSVGTTIVMNIGLLFSALVLAMKL